MRQPGYGSCLVCSGPPRSWASSAPPSLVSPSRARPPRPLARARSPNLRFVFPATFQGPQRAPLRVPEPSLWGGVTFVAKRGHEVVHSGANVRVFQEPRAKKSKPASILVVWSPRGHWLPMSWSGRASAAGCPMGRQIDVRRPLKLPDQLEIVSLAHFGHALGGVSSPPPNLDLLAHQTPSYRDTANLGFLCPSAGPLASSPY